MSDHERPTTVYDDPDMELYDEEPAETLPARPRRRLLTPVTGGLLAVVLVAGGFIGGVQVQKHQAGGSGGGAGNGLPAAFAARLAQGGGAATGAGGATAGAGAGRTSGAAAGTTGTVANIKGSTLYVTSAGGTTVKVKTNDNSKVTRNASSSVARVHPGDTVVIQGSTASGGTVTASSITATAKGVTPAGFGFPGAAVGGGATGTTGAAPGSGATSGGSASQVPQGFAPPSG
jgi:hypothetical protein